MAIKWLTNTIVVTSIHVGANPAASACNVKKWVRGIVVERAGLECEVEGTDDVIVPGLYQKLLLQHHAEIEFSHLLGNGDTNVSKVVLLLGKYFAIT